MAENLLGRITTGSRASLRFFECYYNTSTKKIVVREDGGVVTAGDTTNRTPSLTGYVTFEGSNTITFDFVTSFPYFLKEINPTVTDGDIIFIEPPVYDISLTLLSNTRASSKYAADGEVVLSATGTNSPFDYFDYNPGTDANAVTNPGGATFSGLASGNYEFWARSQDSERILDSTSIVVGVDYDIVTPSPPDPTAASNYGARYVVFESNFNNQEYKTEIWKRDYTGDVETVTGSSQPFGYTLRGEGRDVYESTIVSSNVTVNLISTYLDQFKSLAFADEKEYIIIRSKFNGVTYDLSWYGYMTPSSYQDVLYQSPYSVNISGNDRLGDLNKFDFSLVTGFPEIVTGHYTQLGLLQICLNKLVLNFGYRIACNIFSEGHTTTNMSPLEQTYVDASIYANENEILKCDVVVRDILKIYGARLFSWEGHWYVVRIDEFLNETITYQEYNSLGVRTGSGTWNPRIDFKTPTETERFRWVNGAQSRIFSALYKAVNITIDKKASKGGLSKGFSALSFTGASNYFNFYQGYNLISVNDSDLTSIAPNMKVRFNLFTGTLETDFSNIEPYWEVGVTPDSFSGTYISTTGNFSYSNADSIKIKSTFSIKHIMQGLYEDGAFEYPPFMQLKWSFKLGDLYLTDSGGWSTDSYVNVVFYDEPGSDYTLERVASLPIQLLGEQNSNYELRFYACDMHESTRAYTNDGQINPNLSIIPTANLASGTRRNYMVYNSPTESRYPRTLYYYELTKSPFEIYNPNLLREVYPNDYHIETNNRSWVLVSTWDAPIIVPGVIQNQTKTKYKGINLFFLPNGEEIVDSQTISQNGSPSNNVDLNITIGQHDLSQEVFNEEQLFLNFLKLSNGDPTSNWTIIGESVTRSIQDHLARWIVKLAKRTRAIISGNFRVDGLEFTPLNVLHDPDDSNRLYLPTGVNSNFKDQQYSGEVIEIGSGDEVTTSGFTSGFKQNALR